MALLDHNPKPNFMFGFSFRDMDEQDHTTYDMFLNCLINFLIKSLNIVKHLFFLFVSFTLKLIQEIYIS